MKLTKVQKIILIMVIILLAGGTAIWAVTQYLASDVIYEKGGTQITVEDALDELNASIPYKITYNANGGSGSMSTGSKYMGQNYVIPRNSFTEPTGKYFKEWNTSSDGTGASYAPGATYSENAEMTLYAIWENGYVAYSMGDTVTVGGEQFYVLENSDSTQPKLITKYNLNTAGTAQENATYTTTACAFSTTNYWTNELNLNNVTGYISTDAMGKARSYAQSKGATIGRLLTYEEAYTLKILASSNTKVSTMLWGDEAVDGYLYYWLGSVQNTNTIWRVSGNNDNFNSIEFHHVYDIGVRPVLEIFKDKIGV